jgi:hypothetical protein
VTTADRCASSRNAAEGKPGGASMDFIGKKIGRFFNCVARLERSEPRLRVQTNTGPRFPFRSIRALG